MIIGGVHSRLFLKKVFFPLIITLAILLCQSHSLELDAETRTLKLDTTGNTVVIRLGQVKRGKYLFNNACGACHVGGLSKPNPNIGLDVATLKLASPPRDNITNLVTFFKTPRSYDGLTTLAEIHPNTDNPRIFPKMRSLTEKDLFDVAAHILLQQKILNEKWGGGKTYY